MGSHDITFTWTQRKKMKYQLFLVAILGAACFAAPVVEFDPDCVDDDFSIEEPLVAEPAVGIPDLVWNFEEQAAEDDCVDDPVTAAPVAEDCEDPLPETTQAPQEEDGCITDGVENMPELKFHIEKAQIEEAEPVFVFADEQELPDIEECDEY